MKVFVITDLEGPALVSRFAQTRDYQDEPERKREAMRLLTGEVNAAVDGILEACPDAEVVVWDGHGGGGIDLMAFHPRAQLIPRGPIQPPYYLDRSFQALFFVGQHAMAGTPGAPLCHTYSSRRVASYTLNGRPVGEFGARALMAGALGVPTVFVSGDDKMADEARALVPRIHAAVVKRGLGLELALHLSHAAACALVRQTARAAAREAGTIPAPVLPPPYTLNVRVQEGVALDPYLARGATAVDERTARFVSDSLNALPI